MDLPFTPAFMMKKQSLPSGLRKVTLYWIGVKPQGAAGGEGETLPSFLRLRTSEGAGKREREVELWGVRAAGTTKTR